MRRLTRIKAAGAAVKGAAVKGEAAGKPGGPARDPATGKFVAAAAGA